MKGNSLSSTAKGLKEHHSNPRRSNCPTGITIMIGYMLLQLLLSHCQKTLTARPACSDGQQLTL